MNRRDLIFCVMLAKFATADLAFHPSQADAAQTAVKKTRKRKKVDRKKQYPHGLKNYPWGAPNAGWSDQCIFFYDVYDGWIPPFCRPYGR
jgi:hypothetical protein